MTMTQKRSNQYLIFDADDTLWHNNIYFEQGIAAFIDFLAHSTLTPAEVRTVFDEIERANARLHGYGANVFSRSLHECYERLAEREIDEATLNTIMAFGQRILEQEIELLEGVRPTLDRLEGRHHLILLTKGNLDEQQLKIDRSGLTGMFVETLVVPEKTSGVYADLVQDRGFDPARTWMIGNSPKSDINPALEAGLNAIYIPHEHTWRLEHQEIDTGHGRLLVLNAFSELLDHFETEINAPAS